MNNLEYYKDDTFKFHEKVVKSKRNSKQDLTYVERVSSLNGIVKTKFDEYKNNFNASDLASLKAHGFNPQEIADLQKLYLYRSSNLQKLKIILTTTIDNRVINTCQYCTIGEVGTFDHVLPQSKFPEYVVNPYNLIPCCSICNTHKLNNWSTGLGLSYLNLYLHSLPNKQYLFVDIKNGAGVVETNFKVKNVNGINPTLFSIIEDHYKGLDLFGRFSLNIDDVIPKLVNKIESFVSDDFELDKVVKICIDNSNKDRQKYGFNYWKSILEISLLNDADFLSRFKKKAI